jgi:hypothetical protein
MRSRLGDRKRDGWRKEESGAGDGIRTRDINLGKVALYQLSYSRLGESGSLRFRLWMFRGYSTFSNEIVRKSIHLIATRRLSRSPSHEGAAAGSQSVPRSSLYIVVNKRDNLRRYFCRKTARLC